MRSFVGLGGNLGAVDSIFESAVAALDASPGIHVAQISSFYRTEPMGENAGEAYLNAVAELETDTAPLELLDRLQEIERQHGRERHTHWGPRTLDLDLLLHGETILDFPRLTLPHPGCWYRRFVLDPLAEIAPDVIHPIKQLPMEELRSRLLERPLPIGITGARFRQRQELAETLAKEFPAAAIKPWSQTDRQIPVIVFWIGPSSGKTTAFEDLPLLPRLDLTEFPEDLSTAARHVLGAALGL
ncbi:MAG: 2-amino-4-hydroxy-6-hydroxymethyldihydropteridine diphosphokinase [Planctomycetaceae bacterium]|nr:2-amino-4-hydroxy-6-hydroxymethyldihydropteridine diphosphokinase [Planctomycetaceae bacterium]